MSRLPAEPRDQWTPIHERVSEKLGGHFKTQPLKLALMGHCPRAGGTRGSRITRQHLHRLVFRPDVCAESTNT